MAGSGWVRTEKPHREHIESGLRQAAGDAIDRAIETDDDPFELMVAATGEGAHICVPYVQHLPFFAEKRRLFKTGEDRKRDRDQAALAAEPGPVVWVRRQFDDHRHAAYRIADVRGWHWVELHFSGGLQRLANRYYLQAYVMCDGMIAGELSHTCEHGPPPHREVCITKKGNEKFWHAIEEAAPEGPAPVYRLRRYARRVKPWLARGS